MADEATERITILLQARDRDFQRAIDRNNKLIARMERDATKNTSTMARNIDRNMSQVSSSVIDAGKSFAIGLGAGVIGAAFAGVSGGLSNIVKGIASVGDEAKRSGLGIAEFQEWKFVAEQNRIGVDQLVDGFKELSLRADEFIQTGAGPAAEAIARLGYTSEDLAKKLKDPSALMLEILGRMEGMDKAAQIRIADEMFGGSAGERFVELLAQGQAGLQGTIDRAHEVGAVLDEELIAKADEIDRKFSELGASIGNVLRGLVVEFTDFSEEGAPAFVQAFRAISEAIGEGIPEIERMADAADRLAGIEGVDMSADGSAEALEALRASQEQLGDGAFVTREALVALVEALDMVGDVQSADQVDRLIDRFDILIEQAATGAIGAVELRDELVAVGSEATAALDQMRAIDSLELSGAQSAVAGLMGILNAAAGAAARLRANLPGTTASVSDDRGEAIADAKRTTGYTSPIAPVTSPAPKSRPFELGVPDIPRGGGGGGGGGKRGGGGGGSDGYAGAVENIRERTAALLTEAAAFAEVVGSQQQYGDAAEYAEQRARLLIEAQEQGKAITPELKAEIDALALAYVNAAQSAEEAGDRLDDMRERANRGADAVTDIFMALTEGSDAVKSALSGLLAQMAKVAAQRAFMGMAERSGGGGIFGLIGAALGGARAGGGSVRGGTPYLVNENTPNSELFVPSQSGAVLNVSQAQAALRGAAGGGGGGMVDVRVSVDQNGNLQAYINKTSGDQVRAGVGAYDTHVAPTRIKRVSASPRRVGN